MAHTTSSPPPPSIDSKGVARFELLNDAHLRWVAANMSNVHSIVVTDVPTFPERTRRSDTYGVPKEEWNNAPPALRDLVRFYNTNVKNVAPFFQTWIHIDENLLKDEPRMKSVQAHLKVF